MHIGILSDTHNNLPSLQKALEILRQRSIQRLFHCGDLTDIDTVAFFSGFKTTFLTGNMDSASGAIQKAFIQLDPHNFTGLTFTGIIEGKTIAATHSHLPGHLEDLIRQQKYDYIFHGHTHKRRDETIGKSRIINPGALSGPKQHSFCILDLAAGQTEFVTLK